MNKTLAVDCRIYTESLDAITSMGYDIIKIPQNNSYDEPISAHPDIFMTRIADKWVIDCDIHDLFTFLDELIKFNRGQAVGEKYEYPQDVYLNCVQVGKYLICNKKYTSETVIETAIENNITIIDVKQGYAKCSVCVVSDNAVITEDTGIAAALSEKTDIDVLLIEKGHVKLDGYPYGFFGGCCGLIENDLLVFNGSIEKHPQYSKISDFCNKHGVQIKSLSHNQLYDIGTIIRIK